MSLLAADSFQHYDTLTQKTSYSSGSTAVILAGISRHGDAGVATDGATFFCDVLTKHGLSFADNTVVHGIAVQLQSLPGSEIVLFQYRESDDTIQVTVTIDATAHLNAYKGDVGGTLLATSADPITTTPYYYVESKVFTDDSTGTVEVRLWSDATTMTTPINFTGDTQNGGTGLISKISYGVDGSSPVAHWCDKYVCDTSGTRNNDFLGNSSVVAEVPTGTGTTEWDGYLPTTTNYQNVNDSPPSSTKYNFAPFQTLTEYVPFTAPIENTSDPFPGPWSMLYNTVDSPNGSLPQIGDLLLFYIQYPFGIEPTTPDPTDDGFTLLGEVTSGTSGEYTRTDGWSSFTGDFPLTTRLYWKIAEVADAAPKTYTIGYIPSAQPNLSPPPDDIGWGVSGLPVLLRITNADPTTPIQDYATTSASTVSAPVTFSGDVGLFIVISGVAAEVVGSFELNWTPVDFESTAFASAGQSNGTAEPPIDSIAEITAKLVYGSQSSGLVTFDWVTRQPLYDEANTHAVAIKLVNRNTDDRPLLTGFEASPENNDLDTYAVGNIASTAIVKAVAANLCVKYQDSEPIPQDPFGTTSHTVGGLTKLAADEVPTPGIAPTTDPLIYQFTYDAAPDDSSWTAAKVNSVQVGPRLDTLIYPSAPILTSATPGSTIVDLTWNAADNATSYTIKWGTSPGVYTDSQSGIVFLAGSVTGLTNGVLYYFVVCGDNDEWQSDPSNELSATPAASSCVPGDQIIDLDGSLLLQGDNTEITSWTEAGIHAYEFIPLGTGGAIGPTYDTTPADNIHYSFYNGGVGTINRAMKINDTPNADLGLPSAFTMTFVLRTEATDPLHSPENVFTVSDGGDSYGWTVGLAPSGGNFYLTMEVFGESGGGFGGLIKSTAAYAYSGEQKLVVSVECDGTHVRMMINGQQVTPAGAAVGEWFNNNDSSSVYTPSGTGATAEVTVANNHLAVLSNLLYGYMPYFGIVNTNLSDADRQTLESGLASTYGISYTPGSCDVACVP